MSRRELLADNALVYVMSMLERNLVEFSGRQPTSGQSGVISYATESPNDWDVVLTIGNDASTIEDLVSFEVTYTSDDSQPFPIENIFGDLRVNGEATSNRPSLAPNGMYIWTDGTRRVLVHQWAQRDKTLLTSVNQHRWIFSFSYYKQVTLYFKAMASGTCGGTLSVVRV